MKNIFWLPLIASLLMVACTDKELEEKINPCDGEEVNFSVSADDGKARTLYGDEAADGKSVVVNWVKGDKVLVYGTTCSNPSAEYKVPDSAHGQNYAGKLEKTGAAGVQWGPAVTSDFYSVYPSNSSIEPYETVVVDENKIITSVKVTTEIRQNQNLSFKKVETEEGNKWIGQHYSDDSSNPTMTDAVMYAVTSGAKVDGGPVNLKYEPYSNVFRFTFNGFDIQLKEDELSGSVDNVAYVRQITVTAPFAISGDFPIIISRDGKAKVDEESLKEKINEEEDKGIETTRNSVVIVPDYLPLSTNESVQFDVFTIPGTYDLYFKDSEEESELAKNKYFIVTIETSNFGSFTYHMKPTLMDESANRVIAGQIHKATIPQKTIEHAVTIPMDSWMRFIPRNVYISELSYPGTWYTYDSDYQNHTSLKDLYNAGIRAFHFDTRLTYKSGKSGDMDLYCAGTERSSVGNITSAGTTVLSQLQDLANCLKETNGDVKNEYIIVVLTIAQVPKSDSDVTLGSVNPNDVLKSINTILSKNAESLRLYTNKITSNTTVADVMGKMIVKVNVNANNDTYAKYAFWDGSQFMLTSKASMSAAVNGDITKENFQEMNTVAMLWGNQETDLEFHYHQGQRTYTDDVYSSRNDDSEEYKSYPTYAQREKAIDDIISKSSTIYKRGTHDSWYMLGIGGFMLNRVYAGLLTKSWRDNNDSWLKLNGGYKDEDHSGISDRLNKYLLDKINNKLDSDPSPVGIVLMNHATTTITKKDEETGKNITYIVGNDLVKSIFKFNTKFYLNRDTGKPEWPEDCGGNAFDELYGSEW